MQLLGLPPECSLAWIPCVLVSIYSGLIVLVSLLPAMPELTAAQTTVFGVLVLIAHGLILEVRIAGQCGVRMPFQLILRLGSAILACWILHIFLDGTGLLQQKAVFLLDSQPAPSLQDWALQQVRLLLEIYIVICGVMLLQKGLDTFRISDAVAAVLGPVLRLLGISRKAVSVVIIGFTMGLLYGSGVLIREVEEGGFSGRDSFCAISLLGLSHSLIEDTLVLTLIGGSLWGLLGYRLLFTLAAAFLLNRFYPLLEPLAVSAAPSAASGRKELP